MYIIKKEEIVKPFKTPSGECIYEMIGRQENQGGTSKHSIAHVVIPPNCSSQLHYHPEAEESYYILKGQAKMVIDNDENLVRTGDVIFIKPLQKHQIFTDGDEPVEFLAICAPAWEPNNSVFIDE